MDEWWSVGKKTDFKDGERTLVKEATVVATGRSANDVRLVLWRRGDRFHAMSGRCTRRGYGVSIDDSGTTFTCRKHGSKFGATGSVTRGPARKSLVFYAVVVTDDGDVRVNVGSTVSPPENS